MNIADTVFKYLGTKGESFDVVWLENKFFLLGNVSSEGAIELDAEELLAKYELKKRKKLKENLYTLQAILR